MEHFLELLEKLKKPSTHSNPEDVDPLFCRYNKGWNDAIEKVEKLINSYSLSDMWIPVDVKLPPEPSKKESSGDWPEYIVTIYGALLPTALTYMGEGHWADVRTGRNFTYDVAAWMPMPEAYKEKNHE